MLDITRKQKNKAKSKYRYIRKMVLFAHCLLFFGCKDKSKEIRNTFLTGFRENGVYAAFFNPITQDVYVGTGEGRILLYTPDLVLKDTMKVKKGVVATTLCSPDGKYMVSTSIDGYLYIWDIQERKLVPYFKNKSHSLQSMTCLFSPLQKYVASTGADSTVVILSWPEKKIVKRCKSEHGLVKMTAKLFGQTMAANYMLKTCLAGNLPDMHKSASMPLAVLFLVMHRTNLRWLVTMAMYIL